MNKEDITALRNKLGLSKVDFSRRLGVTPASLWNYETGKTQPSPLARKKLEIAEYHSNSKRPVPYEF